MVPANRYTALTPRTATVVLGVSVLVAGLVLHKAIRATPAVGSAHRGSGAGALEWARPATVDGINWKVLHNRNAVTAGPVGALAKRFRVAGTFFVEDPGGTEDRKAVLDDLRKHLQRVVSEGDRLDDVQVVRIFRDRVVLQAGGVEEELWLSFSKRGEKVAGAEAGTESTALAKSDRYGGVRIGENRWVHQRQSLMDYYTELTQEPERLVAVFDSLKPVYGETGRITGYELGVEGEGKFFESVGLNEGDVVRSANSIPMTSRRRAEFLIRQFVQNKANAFVLEVERSGKREKLIYEIR